MEIFNKFRETIFLKENSNLEFQINKLKEIREKITDKTSIDKDIKLLEIGLFGEKEIAYELKNANIGMYVLHDITLQCNDLTAQIDYIIITKAYCYVVECKNLIGNITVNNTGEFRREYFLNNKKIKEAIYSPYTQAVRHKELIIKKWLDKNSKLTTLFYEKKVNKLYKPLVVLSNSKSLLNIKYAPRNIKNSILRVDQLIQYIKNDIENYNHDLYLSKKTMEDLANSFLEANIASSNKLINKYEAIIDEEQLIEKLKKFRKEKSNRKNVPAYYIFTDKELINMVNNKPKTLEELKSLNILSDVKLNLHGKEIIDIINNY